MESINYIYSYRPSAEYIRYFFFSFFHLFIADKQCDRSSSSNNARTSSVHASATCLNLFHDSFTHILTIQFIVYNILARELSCCVSRSSFFYNSFSPSKYTLYIHISRIVFLFVTSLIYLDPFYFFFFFFFFVFFFFFFFLLLHFYYNYRCFSLCDNFANLRSLAHRLKSNVD